MGRRNRNKRQRKAADDSEAASSTGVVATLALVAAADDPTTTTLPPTEAAEATASLDESPAENAEIASPGQSEGSLKRPLPDDAGEQDNTSEWQTVHRPSKKPKKIPNPDSNRYPSITFSSAARLTSKVNLGQLRDLILYIFADAGAPQWVSVAHRPQFRKIVAIMIPGLEEAMFKHTVDFDTYNDWTPAKGSERLASSPDDYYPRPLHRDRLPEALQAFADWFPFLWPIRTPGDDKWARMESPLGIFLSAPKVREKVPPTTKGTKPAKEPNSWKNERTRITEFLASAEELKENGYEVHPVLEVTDAAVAAFELPPNWVMTEIENLSEADVPEDQIEQGSITAGRKVLAIDCEMCMTGKDEFSLTRISVVNWTGDIILDELVKPDKPIIDYVTQYSGITKEMLEPVKTTLRDIQLRLLDIIDAKTILIGHSLDSDLRAIKLVHPFIVDTSILYPHPRGPPLKSSLKWLSQKYLSREIQKGHGTGGHNSIEDAQSCLDLVRQKCEKGKLWGQPDNQGENLFRRLSRAGTAYKAQGGGVGGVPVGKTSAAVDWGDPSRGPGSGATHRIGCKNDEEVANGVIRAVKGDPDGLEIRAGGVDFVWARMRELEALQGWWNSNRAENASSDGGPPPTASVEQDDEELQESGAKKSNLERCLARLVDRLERIRAALPPCTALIIYSGSGDPREMSRLQQMLAQWKKEYNTPGAKWDDLSVKWTDTEEQGLKRAVKRARAGIGFIGVR